MTRRTLPALLAALAAACHIDTGDIRCHSSQNCPPGWFCGGQGVCIQGTTPDGAADAALGEAAPADGGAREGAPRPDTLAPPPGIYLIVEQNGACPLNPQSYVVDLDPTTGMAVREAMVNGASELLARNGLLYVSVGNSSAGTGTLEVLDPASLTARSILTLGAPPSDMAIDRAATTAYVVSSRDGSLRQIDLGTGSETARIMLPMGSGSMVNYWESVVLDAGATHAGALCGTSGSPTAEAAILALARGSVSLVALVQDQAPGNYLGGRGTFTPDGSLFEVFNPAQPGFWAVNLVTSSYDPTHTVTFPATSGVGSQPNTATDKYGWMWNTNYQNLYGTNPLAPGSMKSLGVAPGYARALVLDDTGARGWLIAGDSTGASLFYTFDPATQALGPAMPSTIPSGAIVAAVYVP